MTLSRFPSEEILRRIETVCMNVTESIAKGEVPELSYSSRSSWEVVSFNEQVGIVLPEERKLVRVRLDNKQSVKSFGKITRVLNIVYKLIQEDRYCTKRDIYYQSPDMFGSQSVIDNVVDNVACMLEVSRWKLHILATCKGLVAGDLQFYDGQGRHVDCNRTKMGVQIPAHDKDMLYLHTDAQLVLVVEKDATFQNLLTEDFCEHFGKVIIITGKGFPDVGTRLLLRKIWDKFKLPVFAVVDADPHGIEIMLVYKYGSKNQAFENQHLTVPGLKWLGILPTDIVKLSLQKNSLQSLSDGDLQKLTDILQRPYTTPHSSFALQVEMMIQSGLKAELQCLDSLDSSYLARVYLPSKIHGGDWI
ncbi:meiotic recombination protein SPO11-like [Babylonia areolata]|uniref:meiotic recombination protein SPO11-like n=1 Tax=Babylonia areolata TaxID=304850 RepID=UPI003FD00F1B